MLTTFHHITGLFTIYGEWISLFIVQVSSALHTDLPAQMVRWKNTVSKSSRRCRRGSSSNCIVEVEVSSQMMYLYNFVFSKPSSFQTIYFPDCWRPFWKHHVWTTAGDKSKIFSSWTKLIEEVCSKGSWAWTCTTSMTAVKALSKGKLMLRFVMPCTAHLYAPLNMSEAEDRPCTVAVDMMKASSLAISYLQHGTLGGGGTSPAVEARGVPASRSHCSLRTSSAVENTHGEHPINMELL